MENVQSIPRPEHPRPDFVRETFLNLNGTWQFAFDDGDEGLREKWYRPFKPLDRTIRVPFAYQTIASGIGPCDEIHPVVWYRRSFAVPREMAGKRILLHFGAVDFACRVYVNGEMVCTHRGGYTPFEADITPFLTDGDNDLCLRVEDAPDCTQPRGKQMWDRGVTGCWYTPVTGIWQTVWLDAAGDTALQQIHITPHVGDNSCTVILLLDRLAGEGLRARVEIAFGGKTVRRTEADVRGRETRIPVSLATEGRMGDVHLWSPEHPDLYDVRVTLLRGEQVLDRVDTFFGMRSVEVRNGRVLLNGEPLYQRLVLDQGYWPDSLITPPSDEAIRQDIRLTLAMGYNGVRKHQKVEDPRYYYWADRMGLLVWGEIPSAYTFTDETVRNLADTLSGFIARDYNHPSLITWVPLNESWGVPRIRTEAIQQHTAETLYHLTKALDGTRLCSCNDGWEQMTTDICALHDYAADGDTLAAHFATREQVERWGCDRRACWADGAHPTGREALMVTEYGGIAFTALGLQGNVGGMETWGYHDKVTDEEAFFARFAGVTDAIRAMPFCQGWCYTQLTDVMQEVNGLLTPDRRPKVDMARLALLNRAPD